MGFKFKKMKTLISIVLLTFSLVVFSQSKSPKIKFFTITSKTTCLKKGHQLVLQKVLEDSRCPEETNCIWEGKAEIVVAIYQNKKEIDETTLSLTSKKTAENIKWFSEQYPSKKIKSVQLLPYPKDGTIIKSKEYYLKVSYSN
jgi:hypothetical protein